MIERDREVCLRLFVAETNLGGFPKGYLCSSSFVVETNVENRLSRWIETREIITTWQWFLAGKLRTSRGRPRKFCFFIRLHLVSSWKCDKHRLCNELILSQHLEEWVLFNMRQRRHLQKHFPRRLVVQTLFQGDQAGLLQRPTTNVAWKGRIQRSIRELHLLNVKGLPLRVWQRTMDTSPQVSGILQVRNAMTEAEVTGKISTWTTMTLFVREILPLYKMVVLQCQKWR